MHPVDHSLFLSENGAYEESGWQSTGGNINQNFGLVYKHKTGNYGIVLGQSWGSTCLTGENPLLIGPNPNPYRSWKIEPIEEYEIEAIDYSLKEGEESPEPQYYFIKEYPTSNPRDTSMIEVFSFNESVTEKSLFSETHGFSGNSNKNALKVPVPTIKDNKISVKDKSAYDYEYTTSRETSHTLQISKTSIYEILPKQSIIVTLSAKRYNNTFYIARLRGTINTFKTLYLKGNWKGEQFYSIEITVRDSKIKKILEPLVE